MNERYSTNRELLRIDGQVVLITGGAQGNITIIATYRSTKRLIPELL